MLILVKVNKVIIYLKNQTKKIELFNATLMTIGGEIINIFIEGENYSITVYRKDCVKIELFF